MAIQDIGVPIAQQKMHEQIRYLIRTKPELFTGRGITAPDLTRRHFPTYAQGTVRAACQKLVLHGRLATRWARGRSGGPSLVRHYVIPGRGL